MNLSEFKAWFEGYTENMKDVPTAKQWARIKDRVGEITAQPTEIRHFYDHYWRPYHGYAWANTAGSVAHTLTSIGQNVTASTAQVLANKSYGLIAGDAFRMLGKADYETEIAL